MQETQTLEQPAPSPAASRLDAIKTLGLEQYVREMETVGYAVIPPEKVATPEFMARVRAALLRVCEKRTGVRFSVDRNGQHGRYETAVGNRQGGSIITLYYILFEDPVFEEWLENPVLQAMVNYFLQGAAHLSSYTSFIKWRDADGDPEKWSVPLHSDSPPLPDGQLIGGGELAINCALCVTEYTKADGSIWMVPGTQTGRQPRPGEAVDRAIPIEAPVGSLIFFKTWHGSKAKMTDGLRMTVTSFFTNRLLKSLDRYQTVVPNEMLDRHSDQFARYLGADDSSQAGIEGPYTNYCGTASPW